MEIMPASIQRGFLKHTLYGNSNSSTTAAGPRPYTGLGSDLGNGLGRCLFAGSWNADIYPALKAHVQPADLHCAKNRMSGLWQREQPLYEMLEREGKETLLFTGVNTDQCVLGTLVDAYQAGWGCVMVDDCCGTTTVGGREVSLHNVAVSYLSVMFVREVGGVADWCGRIRMASLLIVMPYLPASDACGYEVSSDTE